MNTNIKKALIFELDSTALSQDTKAKPSPAVMTAIDAARASAYVIFATNRSWKTAKPYAKLMGIVHPCVTLGGSQVVDPTTNKIIWEQDLDPGVPAKLIDIAKEIHAKIFDYDKDRYVSPKSYKVKPVEPIVVMQIPDAQTQDAVKRIKKIPLLNVEVVPSRQKGVSVVTIKHIHATKFMALQTIAKRLKIDPKQCVGVGSAASDITLLNFCGIKIAMGSATSRLKELAQHIAPPFEEDGLTWVIERYVLTS